MSEVYRFFDSVDGDRAYNAESFAAHFKYVLTSGIFNGGTNLKVTCDGTSMQSHIKMGCAWIEGHSYENTDDNLVLTHDAADGTLDRIDRVVLRLDRNTDKRYIKAAVLKGTAAVTPAAPALTRDSVIYEISLAQILVVHNTSVIAADKVTDERLNESVCGLVNSLIKLETAEMQAEFDAFMASLQGQGYIPASQKGVAGGVALYDTLNSHMAETATSAHKDKNIAVTDANNHFTANNLDGVLDELFTNANDGKTNIAGVIGSPAVSSDTFTQIKDKIQTSKNTLASNLTTKGQSSVGTETLAALVAKVANVNTGRRSASGSSSITNTDTLTISGLSFTPKTVILYCANNGCITLASDVYNTDVFNKFVINGSGALGTYNTTYKLVAGGFTLSLLNYVSGTQTVKWFAIE